MMRGTQVGYSLVAISTSRSPQGEKVEVTASSRETTGQGPLVSLVDLSFPVNSLQLLTLDGIDFSIDRFGIEGAASSMLAGSENVPLGI